MRQLLERVTWSRPEGVPRRSGVRSRGLIHKCPSWVGEEDLASECPCGGVQGGEGRMCYFFLDCFNILSGLGS